MFLFRREKKTSHSSLLPNPGPESLLSHEDLAVRPLSKEVFWSLSLPGGPFGFVIHWPVREEPKREQFNFGMSAPAQLWVKWNNQKNKVPFFHEARTSLILPSIPVLLCTEDMLSKIRYQTL